MTDYFNKKEYSYLEDLEFKGKIDSKVLDIYKLYIERHKMEGDWFCKKFNAYLYLNIVILGATGFILKDLNNNPFYYLFIIILCFFGFIIARELGKISADVDRWQAVIDMYISKVEEDIFQKGRGLYSEIVNIARKDIIQRENNDFAKININLSKWIQIFWGIYAFVIACIFIITNTNFLSLIFLILKEVMMLNTYPNIISIWVGIGLGILGALVLYLVHKTNREQQLEIEWIKAISDHNWKLLQLKVDPGLLIVSEANNPSSEVPDVNFNDPAQLNDFKIRIVCYQHLNILWMAWRNGLHHKGKKKPNILHWISEINKGIENNAKYGEIYKAIITNGDMYPEKFLEWLMTTKLKPEQKKKERNNA